MDKRHINVPLLANSTAFNVGGVGANTFNSSPVYIIDTEFIDIAKTQVRDFQNLYFSKRNTVPSIYALQGYDLVLFFGRMLHKLGERLFLGRHKPLPRHIAENLQHIGIDNAHRRQLAINHIFSGLCKISHREGT